MCPIDRLLFQIFRRVFLSKVWLLNNVPYVSGSRKLPVLSRTFGLGAYDVIMMSSEPQKLVFLLWAQSQVLETFVIDIFSWETPRQHFQSKLITVWRHTLATNGLWRHQTLKTYFFSIKSRPGDENVLKQ